METTAQLLTPPGKGGIAVIRLAGDGADEMLKTIFRPRDSRARFADGRLQLGHLVRPDGEILDEALVQRLGGQAMINIHGGPYVTHAVLDLLASMGAKINQAHPGDVFDPRHPQWDNPSVGREMLKVLPTLLSPLAVAAVAGQWSGGLSRLSAESRRQLRETAAADGGGDIPDRLRLAAKGLAATRRLIHPTEVVLAGEPNAGKSTLANALSGRAMSIVHETPGTTRDWVRELVLIDGVPIWLTDTAGIWEAPSGPTAGIDRQAVERAFDRLRHADLIIVLGDPPTATKNLPAGIPLLRVWPKCDIHSLAKPVGGGFDVEISAVTGAGMDTLRRKIPESLGVAGLDTQAPMAFTSRQAVCLLEAAEAIEASKFIRARQSLAHLLGAS